MGSSFHQRRTLRYVASILILCTIIYTLYNHNSLQTLSTIQQTSRAQSVTGEKEHAEDDLLPDQSQRQSLIDEASHEPAQASSKHNADVKVTSTPAAKHATIGKITISFGEPDKVFDRAIRSHEFQNEKHGYSQFVLRERVLSGLWSKHAYIFSVLVQELAKPEAERLQWVMWLDRDTVLMNPSLRLEEFLPPPDFPDIHLLATNDRHGLNNGAFILRVNQWALKLFHNAMAFHAYNPEVKLKYSEQSAMEEVLKQPWFKASTAMVPQHWFNSFPPPGKEEKRVPGRHARPGSMLIHFASDRDGLRPQRMSTWMDVADQQTAEWCVPFEQSHYPRQIEEYWQRRRQRDNMTRVVLDIQQKDLL